MSEINDISFNFKCTENWDTMSPCDGGRHCNICHKTVYDFSNKSLEEYHDVLLKNKGSICGRFSIQQTTSTLSYFRMISTKWLAGLMLLFGFSSCNDPDTTPNNPAEKAKDAEGYSHTLGVPVAPMETVSRNISKHGSTVEKTKRDSSYHSVLGDVSNIDTNMVMGEIIEDMPEYLHGGEDGMLKFLSENILIKDSVYGKIVVGFTVDTKGKVKDANIIKSLCPLNDAEVLRVVKLLEFSKPKKDTYMNLPIDIDGE